MSINSFTEWLKYEMHTQRDRKCVDECWSSNMTNTVNENVVSFSLRDIQSIERAYVIYVENPSRNAL